MGESFREDELDLGRYLSRGLLEKVSSLPALVDVAKRAIEGAAKSIEIERKTKNMDDPSDRVTGIEDFLDKVGAELRGDSVHNE